MDGLRRYAKNCFLRYSDAVAARSMPKYCTVASTISFRVMKVIAKAAISLLAIYHAHHRRPAVD